MSLALYSASCTRLGYNTLLLTFSTVLNLFVVHYFLPEPREGGYWKISCFLCQVAGNATLYGVCLHVPEIVQRSPGILGTSSPLSHSSGGYKRFLVSAPRCYCLLTRLPFFELHYEMLNRLAEIGVKLRDIGSP